MKIISQHTMDRGSIKMRTVVRNLLGLAFAVKLTVNIFQKENFPGRWNQEQNVFRWLGMIMLCSNVTLFKENTIRTADASKKVHDFSLLYFVFLCPFALYYVPNKSKPNFQISRIFPVSGTWSAWAGHKVISPLLYVPHNGPALPEKSAKMNYHIFS